MIVVPVTDLQVSMIGPMASAPQQTGTILVF